MRLKHEEFYKRMDRIPLQYEMIYKFPLHYSTNICKIIAVGTMIIVPLAYLHNLYTEAGTFDMNFIQSKAVGESDIYWFMGFLAISNVFLYRCCHLVTLRVYRHEQKYVISVTVGILM